MATKAAYTNEEWQRLLRLSLSAGPRGVAADSGGLSFADELAALTQALADARASHGESELVTALVNDFTTAGGRVPPARRGGREQPGPQLADLPRALALVAERGGAEEARGFEAFLHKLAAGSAAMQGEGAFDAGEQLSVGERARRRRAHLHRRRSRPQYRPA